MNARDIEAYLREILRNRIVLLDGSMGVFIQRKGLSEADFRGARFAQHPCDLQGNYDILCLTQPDLIRSIHSAYLEAGADVISTNSFTASSTSQSEYQTDALCYEINRAAARLGKLETAIWTEETPDKPRFVAGSIGPTNRSLSISPRVEDPGFRAVCFEELSDAYAQQVKGLIDGGADLLLVETIFDTLNAKAALFAIEKVFEQVETRLPVMVSVSVSDQSGRTLSGQTLEAFWISIEHARPLCVGLNCGLGAGQMRPFIKQLSEIASTFVSCYPNAGLPNAFGAYDETPETTATLLAEFAREGLVNLVGGCCGTTPEHIRAIRAAVEGIAPRAVPRPARVASFSGLEPLILGPDAGFQMIGERTNVAGSRKFLDLIKNQHCEQAIEVALNQVRAGANILDVNMDDAMLDSEQAMTRFLNLLASEPEIARVPIMIDSSRLSVIEAGLRCVQGKAIVNSISLKEGEEEFIRQAKKVRSYGAALVVMAFDEQGQAESARRKVEVGERAYRILTEKVGFEPQNVIFDPGVLAVATGIEQHAQFGLAFIEAVRGFKARCPHALVSGGISNLSFAFRGNDRVREAMHSAFLYHAINAGLDLAIVNAGQLVVYEEIPAELLQTVEDVLFNRRPDATDRLIALAQSAKGASRKKTDDQRWRLGSLSERIRHAMLNGVIDYIERDIDQALAENQRPMEIIEGPLMEAMAEVGERFGAGKMFLPQVVKSARVMKQSVQRLMPFLESKNGQDTGFEPRRARIVVATVKGDLHDIGKNIVSVVLSCNNYEVIDLGVRVSAESIVDAAIEQRADLVGLSGLITPSLEEMARVASEMQRRGLQIPLLVGGATTSRQHTAVKIAPMYSGTVVHVKDASRASVVAASLLDPKKREAFEEKNREEQERLRNELTANPRALESYQSANQRGLKLDWSKAEIPIPEFLGPRVLRDLSLLDIAGYIDWTFFFLAWGLKAHFPEIIDHPEYGNAARELFANANALLQQVVADKRLTANGVYGFWPANAQGNDLIVWNDNSRKRERVRLNMLRQQARREEGSPRLCLSDFVAPIESGVEDYIGLFAVTAGIGVDALVEGYNQRHDDYAAIMVKALADRLAEAFSELLHQRARREWGYGKEENLTPKDLFACKYRGIRPAYGYPACPDHSEKAKVFALLNASEVGINLTETYAMAPAASVSGIYLAHPQSRYFVLGPIGQDQLTDYARRKAVTLGEAKKWLAPHLSDAAIRAGA
ncbi:MAG: methionine synthase [Deltaproteobacteria bacterium]|nr:methionine synthase [Deltaproteobacteria bacterium]